ncbi:MAG: hypothetical protein NC095_01030 [Muribaculum sp.]|nr:hypothetical protein [Muribaculum sp.]
MSTHKIILNLFAVFLISLGACSNGSDSDFQKTITEIDSKEKSDSEETFDKMSAIEIPVLEKFNLAGSEASANEGINKFSLSFFNIAVASEALFNSDNKKINQSGNIAISPLSVAIALSMTANSCDDSTENTILEILGCDDLYTLSSVVNQLMRYLSSSNNGIILELANSAYYKNELTPFKEWETILSSKLYSSVLPLDFDNPSSIDIINDWCSLNTHGKILNFLNSLDSSSVVLLLNTLYFYGSWNSPFNQKSTVNKKFHSKDYGIQHVDMMTKTSEFGYFESDKYQFLSIPFRSGITEMEILLPKEEITAMDLAKTLSYDDISYAITNKQVKNIALTLPKFNISTSADITPLLNKLGLPKSINLDKMGILTLSDEKPIKVMQKTETLIDEKGAELATATEVEIFDTSTGTAVNKTETIIFDKPFLCFFINKNTGTILMASVINNIQEK